MNDNKELITQPVNYKKYLIILTAMACAGLGVYLGVIDKQTAMSLVQTALGM